MDSRQAAARLFDTSTTAVYFHKVCQRGDVNVHDRDSHSSGRKRVGPPYGRDSHSSGCKRVGPPHDRDSHCSGRKCVGPDDAGPAEPAIASEHELSHSAG